MRNLGVGRGDEHLLEHADRLEPHAERLCALQRRLDERADALLHARGARELGGRRLVLVGGRHDDGGGDGSEDGEAREQNLRLLRGAIVAQQKPVDQIRPRLRWEELARELADRVAHLAPDGGTGLGLDRAQERSFGGGAALRAKPAV